MVRREDFDLIVPDGEVKGLAQRKLLLVVSIVGIIALIIIIVLAALLGNCGKSTTQEFLQNFSNQSSSTTISPTTISPTTISPTTISPTTFCPQPKEECRTPPCIHSAAWISDNMDTSVNPCENFYKFSCGGWEKRNSIPPDRLQVSIVNHLEDEIEEKLREIIEHIPQRTFGSSGSDNLDAAEGKLQLFFRSCVNDYGRMKASGGVLVNKIKSALKGWYVLNPTNWSSQFDVNEAIAATQADFATDVFFNIYPAWDYNLKKYAVGVQPMYRYIYYNSFNSSQEITYRNYIRAIGGMLLDDSNVTVNSSEKETRVEQFVSDVYRMETDLFLMYYRIRWNSTFTNTTTLDQFQSAYPQVNWGVILTRMFNELGVNNNTLIRVYQPLFFRQLNDLILNETQMHIRDRIFNNYMVWQIAFKYANDLSWKYREAYNNYQEALWRWYYERPSTWKTCLDTVHNNMGTLLKYEFIKNHLSPEKKDEVNIMYTDIRQAVVDRLEQISIIDDETKTSAKNILESLIPKVGFSDIYYNQTVMAQLHSSLNITPTATYFENLLSLVKFRRKRRIEFFLKTHEDPNKIKFGEESDHAGWIRYWVMPYLNWYRQAVRVPPGSMLEPLYNSKRPGVVNYGVLGSLVARQLMSSFDRYNSYITLKNGSYVKWWTRSMDRAYRRSVDCFRRYFEDIQVGPYLVEGRNQTVNVTVTYEYMIEVLMREYGGIRAAYNGYKKWMNDTGSNDPVPVGLDLTRDQLFFVSSVQSKCYLRRDETSYQYALWDILPEDAQVNTLLSRMSEFSTAFNCSENSKMKKANICETF